LVIAKDEDGIFIQKLMEIHVNTSYKVLTRVMCIKKLKSKIKKKKKQKKKKKKGVALLARSFIIQL
jgi:hypothetical protein